MVKKSYIPERGDVVWLHFDPQTGHEQAGRRPALILSPQIYNRPSGMALVCPITTKIKRYPFEVPIEAGKISGVVLSDQVKSLDWKERKVTFIARSPDDTVLEVIEKISALLCDG